MNVKLENMHVIRMHFALILKAVMVAFAKMVLMVMDSIAVFYVLKEQNHRTGSALILTNVL